MNKIFVRFEFMKICKMSFSWKKKKVSNIDKIKIYMDFICFNFRLIKYSICKSFRLDFSFLLFTDIRNTQLTFEKAFHRLS